MIPYTELTAAEIETLQNLLEGWRNVWDKVWIELYSRLPATICKSVPLQYRDEFIAYFVDYCDKKLLEQELFAEFDVTKGDIFAWLCNPANLGWRIREFRRQELRHKIKISQHKNKETGKVKKVETRIISGNIEDEKGRSHFDKRKDERRNIANSVYDRLHELVAKITESPLILNNDKNDTIPQHSCLQLYPHIDKSSGKMQTLITATQATVRKVNALHTNPDKTILYEHEIAEERFHTDKQNILDELDTLQWAVKRRQELEGQLASADYERLFVPLIVEQVVKLEGVTENTASAHRSRYRRELPNLLPQEIKKKWENLQNNELSD